MAEPEIVASDLRSPYGIAFDADDVLFVSESGANRIVRVDDGQSHPFALTGPRPLGIAFDDSGDLFVAESGRHHLILISPDEAVEIYAHSCRGRRFIGPRQLCFAHTGDVLFSDSGHPGQADGSVYRADLDGEVTEVASGLSAPAGMVLSEDAAILYVSERGLRRILSLEIDDEGRPESRQVFYEFGEEEEGAEDLLFDTRGDLYASCPGAGIVVIDPDGRRRGLLEIPGGQVAGMIFGGLEYDRLFVAEAATGCVYGLPLQAAGQRPFAGPRSI